MVRYLRPPEKAASRRQNHDRPATSAAGLEPQLPLEGRWYRRGAGEVGNRQFAVADPDGYLLRFFTDLGERPLA